MSLDHALLGLLAAKPGSGYDLLKRFDRSLAFVWPATQSQLYTVLGRLDRDGLIEVASVGPRGRKEYAITEAGRDEVVRWLTETEPERTFRREDILRVFFLWTVPKRRRREYFEQEAERFEQFHAALQGILETTDWDEDPLWDDYGRIALEQGLRATKANAEWARWAVDQVDSTGPERKTPAS
jgi:DNA-binding PadR family transcriptional regulator